MEKHVTSFNDIIRSRLEDLYEENELEDFIFNIFDSLNRKDSYAYPAAYASFSVIFLDAYKELNSKVLDGSASLAEIELFSLLKDASSLEEIMDLYCISPRFMDVSSAYNVVFNNRNDIEKIKMIKQLSDSDNNFLLKIAPIHEMDLIGYGNCLNKDWLYDYYKDYTKKLEENRVIYSEGVLIDSIIGPISMISSVNKKEIIDLVSSVSEDIFSNIDNIENLKYIEKERLESFSNIYNYSKSTFYKTCADSKEILSCMFRVYFEMRDRKIIKTKSLKKDKNE